MKAKKLKGVKPFNEFLFVSCYYHQLMAAYSCLGVSADKIISDHFFVYRYDAKKKRLSVEHERLLSARDFADVYGVRLVKKRKIGDLAAEIVRSIDGGCPAVVPWIVSGFLIAGTCTEKNIGRILSACTATTKTRECFTSWITFTITI